MRSNRKEKMRSIKKEKPETEKGTILEALPNTSFRVQLNDSEEVILVYLSGKMRMYRIKVLIGDTVEIVLDDQRSKGRIVRRL